MTHDSRELRSFVGRLVAPLANRVRLAVGRAVVNLIDDTQQCQTIQVDVLDGETQDTIEHFQPYGFTGNAPTSGAEGVYLSVGGIRSNGIVLAVQNRKLRIKGLASGEVAIYDDQGSSIVLKHDKHIEITAQKVNVVANTINLGADSPSDALAMASLVMANLNALVTAVNGWTPVVEDGGAALKVILSALFATWPMQVKSNVVGSS